MLLNHEVGQNNNVYKHEMKTFPVVIMMALIPLNHLQSEIAYNHILHDLRWCIIILRKVHQF